MFLLRLVILNFWINHPRYPFLFWRLIFQYQTVIHMKKEKIHHFFTMCHFISNPMNICDIIWIINYYTPISHERYKN